MSVLWHGRTWRFLREKMFLRILFVSTCLMGDSASKMVWSPLLPQAVWKLVSVCAAFCCLCSPLLGSEMLQMCVVML